MTLKLRTKILLSYMVLFAVILGAVTWYTTRYMRVNLSERFETRLRNELALIANMFSLQRHEDKALQEVIQRIGRDLGLRLTAVDARGVVLADSQVPWDRIPLVENHANRREIREAIDTGFGKHRRSSTTVKQDLLYMARKVHPPDREWLVVRVSAPLDEIEEDIANTLRILYVSSFVAFLMLLLFSIWLANHITLPLRSMTHMAERIAQGDFEFRILHYPEDELGTLAQALNRMAQELKTAMEQLHAETAQLTSVFRGMLEGVMVVNDQGEIVLVNSAFKRFFPETRRFEGQMPLTALRNSLVADSIRKALEGTDTFDLEIALGSHRNQFFHVNVVALRQAGQVKGCIAVFHDITQIKKLEEVRKDFVANVSHELRTPLTAIRGYAETLLEDPPDNLEQATGFLELIVKHANRLSSLTADLLRLSAMDSGRIQFQRSYIESAPFLNGIAETFSAQIQEKSLTLELETVPEPLNVYADPEALTQIFTNLMDNAVKYTPEGGRIRCSAQEEDSWVHFRIQDSGIGIPQKDLERIFERFYRVDRERSREQGGTGLGLAIVKHLVQAQKGKVWAESRLMEGSTFHVVLPKAPGVESRFPIPDPSSNRLSESADPLPAEKRRP